MRYVPHTEADIAAMLEVIGLDSVEALFDQIPESIRLREGLNLARQGLGEMELRREMSALARENRPAGDRPCFLGAGLYDHYIPATVPFVMSRSELSTSYTPYQAEMSQGILQGLYEFQSMIAALYEMEVCNASMYDGASALAEAVLMACDMTGRTDVMMPLTVSPFYRAVVATYLSGTGARIVPIPYRNGITDVERVRDALHSETACVVIAWPNFFGCLEPMETLMEAAHGAGALAVVAALPVAMGLLRPPGSFGADIVVGEGQGLGLPLSFGGPLLGLFCCKKASVRKMPGRVVGATVDRRGQKAYTLTLQTREQHIRRERATSNICTSQSLCAIGAAVYLSLMGPRGLRMVATRCAEGAHVLAERLRASGVDLKFTSPFFFEFVVETGRDAELICRSMAESGWVSGYSLGREYPELKDGLLVCVTEKRTADEIEGFVRLFKEAQGRCSMF